MAPDHPSPRLDPVRWSEVEQHGGTAYALCRRCGKPVKPQHSVSNSLTGGGVYHPSCYDARGNGV